MTDASQPRLNRGHDLLVCALIAVLLLTPEGKVEHHASADGLTDTPLKAEELPDNLSCTLCSAWRTIRMPRPSPSSR